MTELNGNGTVDLADALVRAEWSNGLLEERLAELELSLEDTGWRKLTGDFDLEFSRDALRQIGKRSRYSFLSNPLINHAIEVQQHYVFGQGVSMAATHPLVNDVVQAFIDDPGNQAELTSDQALLLKEVELATTGNLFLVLFPNPLTGEVRVRSIVVEEIQDIITNPEDRQEPWYYLRTWQQRELNAGRTVSRERKAYYPDWRYTPRAKPASIDGVPVHWASPVYHRKVGGFSHMRFGVPETYSALDWAVAVREDLEDWATIRRAHARFATRVTTKGGSRTVAAVKSRMNTTYGAPGVETNPAPAAGSAFIESDAVKYQPIPLANMSPNPEEGRRLGLMVSAGVGIPETILFGNAEVGNLATAKTLDRPTELKMRARQTLWKATLEDLLNYAIDWAVAAPKGMLARYGTVQVDPKTGVRTIVMKPDPEAEPDPRNPDAFDPDAPMDRSVVVSFPALLERDTKALVEAIAAAVVHLPDSAGELIARLLLDALGVDDPDEWMDKLFPPDAEPEDDDEPEEPPPLGPDLDVQFVAALRDVKTVLEGMRG